MSIFIQEVLGLLKRNQKKITLDKTKDWFEFGKLYQSSVLNTGASYNPKMDPFVIKWGDLVCQATEDLTRTLPGEGKLGYVPVYTDPSGFCSWDTLKDSIITQNSLNTIITIGGNLVVTGDVAINGGDLTSTASNFNLLQQSTTIGFGYTSQLIVMGGISATSTVLINGTQESTSCTTGAFRVNGGVGIAKNLNVCGDITVSLNSYLNGDVYLGNALADQIEINGTLLDNNGNPAAINQALVGTGTGAATWQNIITSFNVAGDSGTPQTITNGNTISIAGGTALTSVASATDIVTINHDDYGTPGTYAFPSSITTNAQGHITSITAGTGAGVTQIVAGTNITISPTGGTGVVTINSTAASSTTASNGLTMSTATNVILGGTLIQNTTINNSTFDFVVSRTNSGDAIFGTNSSSGGGVTGRSNSGYGVVGASVSGVGVSGTSETFRAGQFFISPVSDNTVVENTIFQRIVAGSAPANNGIGQSLVFENAIKSGSLASANTLISKFTSTSDSARTSEFSITGVNAGTTGNKLILSGNGTLRLPDYGVGNKPGTATYNLSVTSTGNVIETAVSNYAPRVYVSMLTQTGSVDPPSTIVIFDNITSGSLTLSWSRISAGLYELTCNQPLFTNTSGSKSAIFATPNITSRPYFISLERVPGNPEKMQLNCFEPTTGNSQDNLLDKATFKIELYD
jgi:hypothetical protein